MSFSEDAEANRFRTRMLRRWKSLSPLFLAVVALPSAIATVYFGLLADDVFVSESRLIVRGVEKPDLSPVGAALGANPLSGPSEESSAVTQFIQSRGALQAINEDGLVAQAYGNESVFLFDRFGGLSGNSFEQLYRYFQDKVAIEDGDNFQTLTLSVRAFNPQDAQAINERLLQQSEQLVNDLSGRARDDAIQFSRDQVSAAREEARAAALALARFRDQEGVIDPELQAEVGLQTIGQLQQELSAARSNLRQLQTYTPKASQIPYLKAQVSQLEQDIERETARMAGGRQSLSANASRFQELTLASQFAEQQLSVALTALQEAQADASRQQAYIERISQPSLPDYPMYPRRVRSIFATFVLGLLAWGVIAMLLVGIREHRE